MVWINRYQDWLSDADSLKNAQKVVDYLYKSDSDWTKESIAALIGNMKHESSINPNMYEYGYGWEEERGFGLVQWTPRSKFWDWGVSNGYSEPELRSGDSQLARLDYEVDNNIQYIANGHQWRYGMGDKYDFSFTHFRTNQPGLTVEQLTEAFMWNYEGPAYEAGTGSLSGRQAFALRAFNELNWTGGSDPNPPDPEEPEEPSEDISLIEQMIHTLYDYSNGQFGNSYIKGTKTMDNMYTLEITQAFRDKLNGGGGTTPDPPDPQPDASPVLPVAAGTPITDRYGPRINPVTFEEELHNGTDWGGALNDDIYAVMNGEVVAVDYNDLRGNWVMIQHSEDNYYSKYLHLNSASVTVGQVVTKGSVIGKMGTTGQSTGIHLHLSITTEPESGWVDPEIYLGLV